MPYIIRNAVGEICGRCTNAPAPGNKLPDGSAEVVEFIEEDTPESLDFVASQKARADALVKQVVPTMETL